MPVLDQHFELSIFCIFTLGAEAASYWCLAVTFRYRMSEGYKLMPQGFKLVPEV